MTSTKISPTIAGEPVQMLEIPPYCTPEDTELTEEHVREALEFLVAVEPHPPVSSRAEYEDATTRYEEQIEQANLTLRRFAEQIEPLTLDAMQKAYYAFANDPRYLTSIEVSANVTASLTEAWNGIGPWRR